MKTKFLRFTESGKKEYELEVEQKDCDELNAISKELGLDKYPDYKEQIPTKCKFLLG